MSTPAVTTLAAILGAEGNQEFADARRAVLAIGRESSRIKVIETMAELIEEAEELGKDGAAELVEIAQTLQDRRAFGLLLVLCLLAERTGLSTHKLKQKEIQALIELKRLREAVREARRLIDTTRPANPEAPIKNEAFGVWMAAKGNLGRALKQTYVNAALAREDRRAELESRAAADGQELTDEALQTGLADLPHPDPSDLHDAARAYLDVWDTTSKLKQGSTYHAINAAALISRAARDTGGTGEGNWASDEGARQIAEAIIDIHGDDLRDALGHGSSPGDLWTLATCGEAFLVLGRLEDAAHCYGAYAGNPANTAFNLASSLRQLQEVWTLSGDDPGTGGSIIRVLKAALLNLDHPKDGDDVDDVPTEAVQLSVKEARLLQSDLENAETEGAVTSAGFEAYFGKRGAGRAAGAMVDVARLIGAVHRARSICAIQVLRGGDWVPGGTGFVMDGGALSAAWSGQRVILTNYHVTAQNDATLSASFKRCRAVFVDVNPYDGNDLEFYVGFKQVLWASGLKAHDTVVLQPEEELPSDVAPLTEADVTDYLPKRKSPDRDGTDMHVVILGFPGERKLSYSFGDELLLDHDASPPGKAPQIPPELDGAPVRLHYRTPSLPGSSGSPVFESGSWRLVGIHHRGHPETPRLPPKNQVPPSTYEANEGIWLQSIKAAIAADAAAPPAEQESFDARKLVQAGAAAFQAHVNGHTIFARPLGGGGSAPTAPAASTSIIEGNHVPFQDDASLVRRRYLRRGVATEADLEAIDAHAAGFETVIGDDNRVQILDTVADPFRMICSLVAWFEGGIPNFGTGFMVGRRTIVTAGHVLLPGPGLPALEAIEIRPGRAGPNPDMEPFLSRFGPIQGKRYSVHEGWARSFDPRLDIGAIHLDMDIGDEIGWFRIASRQPGALQRVWGHVTGFPGDKIAHGGKRATEMWHHATPITAVADARVYYPADTFAGQSGAPVYVMDEDDRACVIGIHAYGSGPNAGDLAHSNNSAVHVDEGILQLMADWRTVT